MHVIPPPSTQNVESSADICETSDTDTHLSSDIETSLNTSSDTSVWPLSRISMSVSEQTFKLDDGNKCNSFLCCCFSFFGQLRTTNNNMSDEN